MKLLLILLLLSIAPTKLLAYRDGAREDSCYNHTIIHDGALIFECNPPVCPFFLRIREVVNGSTLELGNETDTYQCGKLYGIELASRLNDPEGFLIQARNGTDISSEILGEFLEPNDVGMMLMRDPMVDIQYKILRCNQSMESDVPLPYQQNIGSVGSIEQGIKLNSATHPRSVDMAEIIQLYWRAPNCSTCGLGNLTIWFTVVQQLRTVFYPSKSTILQLRNYTEPEECLPPTTAPPTTTVPTLPPITTFPQEEPLSSTQGPVIGSVSCSNQSCTIATAITAVVCSLFFFVAGAISGGLGVLCVTIHQQRKVKKAHQLLSDPVYEEMPSGKSTAPKMMTPVSVISTEASESHIEMETNAAYGDCRGQIN